MNSKTILKRTLPIIIALVVILVIALVSVLATKAKKVPGFKEIDKDGAYVTYTLDDGSKITVTNQMVYETLTGSSTAASATVSEIVDMIDKDLLADYITNAKQEDVYDKIANAMLSDSFEDYLEDNEDDYKLAAKKDGKTYEEYTNEQLDEAIEDFVEKMNVSYGIDAEASDFSYLDASNHYAFTVKADCDVYAYYLLQVARTDYANKMIKEEYAEALAEYNYYEKCLEAYNNYQDDYEDYEDELADWKNTAKSERGDKPTEPKKSDYYVEDETYGTYKLKDAPEAVDEPKLVESDFEDAYEDDNYDKFWVVNIPYASKEEAETALLQQGVVIAENADGDYTWFYYGTTNYSGDDATRKELEDTYTVKGKTTIITDNDYYETLTAGEKDTKTGAIELTEEQIKPLIVALYNQFYQAYPEKQLVAGTDYDATTFAFTDAGKEKIEYTQTELSDLGIYSTASTNKFYKFDATDASNNAFRDTYTYTIQSGSSVYCIYLIIAKEDNLTWDEYLEAQDCEYYETQYYKDNLDEMLEDKVTTTYINTKAAALRCDADLLIYDETLEASYMDTYTSDYEATKKSNKYNVVSYKVNGEKKYISVDEVYEVLAAKYGAVSAIDKYQYEWMLLEAKNSDGELYNKYVDYAAYKNGKKLSKCIYKTDEAKELYETVETYVDNTKNNFSSGNYEDSGYAASYGWNNFLEDYFLENYGIKVTSTEELKLFYIYQQVVTDYCEDLAKVNKDLYTTVYYTYMAETLANELNTTGVHFLISYVDEDGNMVDPYDWTTEQETAAKALYDEVLDLVKIVPTADITTVLSDLADALNDSPLPETDGSQPNVKYYTTATDGTEYSYNYLTYDFTYYVKGADNAAAPYTINVAKYKAAGIQATSESLTVTEGSMVTPFEDAVRQIWNKQLSELAAGEEVDTVVVYDHTYTPDEYANNGNYLATQYGYHVYINLTSSLSSYFTTDEADNTVFIGLPSYEHVLMYLYTQTQSSEDDYEAWDDLYEDYTDAVKEDDADAIQAAKDALVEYAKKAGITDATWDTFEDVAKRYCDDDYKSYTSSEISTWFTSYSSDAYTLAYSDFTSSSYYQLSVMKSILANMSKFTFTGADQAKFEDTVNYYVESYTSGLSYVSFMAKDKDAVKSLLEALNAMDYETFITSTKLFTDSDTCTYAAERDSLVAAFAALNNYAKDAYNALSTEDKAELADLATVLK